MTRTGNGWNVTRCISTESSNGRSPRGCASSLRRQPPDPFRSYLRSLTTGSARHVLASMPWMSTIVKFH